MNIQTFAFYVIMEYGISMFLQIKYKNELRYFDRCQVVGGLNAIIRAASRENLLFAYPKTVNVQQISDFFCYIDSKPLFTI